ncbi:hypothetical protein TWF281_002969 [Arthrobotrys megalospora]
MSGYPGYCFPPQDHEEELTKDYAQNSRFQFGQGSSLPQYSVLQFTHRPPLYPDFQLPPISTIPHHSLQPSLQFPPQPLPSISQFPPQSLPRGIFYLGDSDPAPRFPHPSDGRMSEPMPYREACIRRFSAAIRNKPNWTEKILDRRLFAKWLRETKEADSYPRGHKTLIWEKDDIDFVYEELTERYKPYVEACGGRLEPDIDGVWRCDNFLDEKSRQDLIDAIATLENIPGDQKDWHPGSNNTVLNLVHPSLWPIVYGRTIGSDGEALQHPNGKSGWTSKEFCWLPSEFEISADGKTKIASYVNNLSTPEQKHLFYPILEEIFNKLLPLFNHVLANLRDKSYDPLRVERNYYYSRLKKLLQKAHDRRWERLLKQFEEGRQLTVKLHKSDPDEEYYEYSDDENLQSEDNRSENSDEEDDYGNDCYAVRDLGCLWDREMWRPPPLHIREAVKLEGQTARVIVKLANIVLTPENPKNDGGTWHVEAMENERIVSTGIYYYSQENITESKLAFRKEVGLGKPDEYEWLGDEFDDEEGNETWRWNNKDAPREQDWEIQYDMNILDQPNQDLGAVETKENRAIAFPNIFQHKVQPFELIDKSKAGYRKILVFFLCDPTSGHNIPTTKTVAPQQPEPREELIQILNNGPVGNLPPEIYQSIMGQLPPVISKEEALENRRKLMMERGRITRKSGERLGRSTSYHLCEH